MSDMTTPGPGLEAVAGRTDETFAQELVERARAEGTSLVGPGGLLTGLTKTVLETALEVEMDDHLGYPKHAVEGRDRGNSRNGTRSKTVLTEIGEVQIEVPRDRDGSFEPKIVAKRQRRLVGVDELVISLTAKGLTTGEISAHFQDVYGAEVSRDTISRITDRVLEELAGWQTRPLDRVYPVIFIDAIHVKILEPPSGWVDSDDHGQANRRRRFADRVRVRVCGWRAVAYNGYRHAGRPAFISRRWAPARAAGSVLDRGWLFAAGDMAFVDEAPGRVVSLCRAAVRCVRLFQRAAVGDTRTVAGRSSATVCVA